MKKKGDTGENGNGEASFCDVQEWWIVNNDDNGVMVFHSKELADKFAADNEEDNPECLVELSNYLAIKAKLEQERIANARMFSDAGRLTEERDAAVAAESLLEQMRTEEIRTFLSVEMKLKAERDAAVAERDAYKKQVGMVQSLNDELTAKLSKCEAERDELLSGMSERISKAELAFTETAFNNTHADMELWIRKAGDFERKLTAMTARAEAAESALKMEFVTAISPEVTALEEKLKLAEKHYEELYTITHEEMNSLGTKLRLETAELKTMHDIIHEKAFLISAMDSALIAHGVNFDFTMALKRFSVLKGDKSE